MIYLKENYTDTKTDMEKYGSTEWFAHPIIGVFHVAGQSGERDDGEGDLPQELHQGDGRRVPQQGKHVAVVYHVTIVAIGHGLLRKFWLMFIVS